MSIYQLSVFRGSEFTGQHFRKLLQVYKIKQSHPKSSPHAPHVERVNQTLQKLIYKYLASKEGSKYIDKLQDLVRLYNGKPHRSISPLSPQEAELESSRGPLVQRIMKNYTKVYLRARKQRTQLKVGDKVVTAVTKGKFHRGYSSQFNSEVHTIVSIDTSKYVPLYKIQSDEDGEIPEGFFYEAELQRVNKELQSIPFPKYNILKKKGKGTEAEVFIEWNELPSSFNSWIPENILKSQVRDS